MTIESSLRLEILTMLIRSFVACLRWGLFLGVLAATACWILAGYQLTGKLGGSASPTADEMTKEIIKRLQLENPQAAAELTRIRENNDINAVAAALSDAEARGETAAVEDLVDRKIKTGKTPAEIRLASLAVDPNLLPTKASRDEFLWAHASAVQVLDQDSNGAAADAYLNRLEQSAQSPESWRIAKANPMAMLVVECVTATDLREYYEQDQVWLDPVIVGVAARADMSDSEKKALVSDVVRVAYDNRPYFKQAVTEQKLDAGAFFLFAQFGPVIRLMAGSGNVPLNETLDVIFANSDFLQRFKADAPEKLAARLLKIRVQKPAVWRAARKTFLALRLNEDAPNVADRLFEKYAVDDIAALLYAGYEGEVVYAAQAVDKFGDLAIYILNRYVRSRRFHEALRANFGPRLIPYVARFGDQGIERLGDNQGWLDKYFQRDGTPKEDEWWTQIPGGGALNVARNWAKGYPNEWSELGWGALDVADAALAVASFGASEAVTETAQEGAEIVVKAEVKDEILRAGESRASAN